MVGIVIETLLQNPWACDAADLERIAHATASAGFRTVSVWGKHAAKMGPHKARAILNQAGLTVHMAELAPPWWDGPVAVHENLEKGLEMFGVLGAELMLACHGPGPAADLPRATDGFALLCEHAAKHGIRVAIEFIPTFRLRSLSTAWKLVRDAGAANGGLVVDTMHWHYQQGGPDFDLLRSIPGDKIYYVQLCDAALAEAPMDGEEYMKLATTKRPLPGDGIVDIRAALRTLTEIGADPSFGMEVYNAKLAALGANEMAKQLHENADQLFR